MEIIMNVVTFQCDRKTAEEIINAIENDNFGYGRIDCKKIASKPSGGINEENKVSFETPWGSPVELIREITKNFVGVAIAVKWAAESIEFGTGGYECKDGRIISEYHPQTEKEQKEFSDRVWYEGYNTQAGEIDFTQ